MTKESTTDLTVSEQPMNFMQVIQQAALDPNVDTTKMKELLDMQERILDREGEHAFNNAMQKAQENMPDVARDKENAHTKSKYAALETIIKTIKPVILSHGFAMSYGSADSPLDGHYRVTCCVSHTGGFSKNYFLDIPADATGPNGKPNKSMTHALGSTMSYGRRYLVALIFDIAFEGEDDDGNGTEGKGWKGPLGLAALKEEARKVHNIIANCKTMDAVDNAQKTFVTVLDQLEHDLPEWFEGDNGIQQLIADKRESITAVTG